MLKTNQAQTGYFVTARYRKSEIPSFVGNPLIEALPPVMSDEMLIDALTLKPSFDPAQRSLPTELRLLMVKSTSNFMVPLQQHVELCRALESLIRPGYVGRAPHTPGHTEVFQKIYDMQMSGGAFVQTVDTNPPKNSTALIGISGMGKSTTVKRWCAHLPPVIYHPELHVFQVTHLHIETPSDGSSSKGLTRAILQKIDSLVPGANYYETYAKTGREGAEHLIQAAASVMNKHHVGILICDEIQNIAVSGKGTQRLMVELVSLCNLTNCPILFVGTNKAKKVLTHDFSKARRGTGEPVAPWDRMLEGNFGEANEWNAFLSVLWCNQWVRKPVNLDASLSSAMYECSQGIIDVALKLFATAQACAMYDGSETLTPKLIRAVYKEYFQLLHPMLEALRSDDYEALAQFDDITPLDFNEHLERLKRHYLARTSPVNRVRSGDDTYLQRVQSSLMSIGIDAETAAKSAKSVADQRDGISLGEGVVKALELAKPKKALKTSTSKSKKVEELPVDRFDAEPSDYRRAIAYAQRDKSTVFHQINEMGWARDLDEILSV